MNYPQYGIPKSLSELIAKWHENDFFKVSQPAFREMLNKELEKRKKQPADLAEGLGIPYYGDFYDIHHGLKQEPTGFRQNVRGVLNKWDSESKQEPKSPFKNNPITEAPFKQPFSK